MCSKLSLEAKVRAIKLVEVDGLTAADALADLEQSFGIIIKDQQKPEDIIKNMARDIIKQLHQTSDVSRSRLVKLLVQAQLITQE